MFGFRKKPHKYHHLYHYLITVHIPDSYGSYAGTIMWSGTRSQAFDKIFDDACADSEFDPVEAYVSCWSFEPDDLP